jgi:hypothetical protein
LIRGLWHPRYPLPLVQVGILVEGFTDRWHLLNFVIDTGATNSCIHPRDAHRLGIPRSALDPGTWEKSSSTLGIGGRAFYKPCAATYAFVPEENPMEPLNLSGASVRLAASTPANQRLPSLLGWDVLRHFRLTIDSDEVWLERR